MTSKEYKNHIAIVGATGTGKTALAQRLAAAVEDVELISVDAMAVYIGFDIGTAKPLGMERSRFKWHLLDLVEADREFSVAEFQQKFNESIAQIEVGRKRAILVGGTGLYHRAVIDNLELPSRYPEIAKELEDKWSQPSGAEELYGLLVKLDSKAAEKILPNNMRRVVRALEVTLGSGRPFSSFGPGLTLYEPNNIQLFGLSMDRKDLSQRLSLRLDMQLETGFVEEVRKLYREKEISKTARQAIGYAEIFDYLEDKLTFDETKEKILKRTRDYAKRQEAWFRRDPRVCWLKGSEEENFRVIYEYMTFSGHVGY